MTAQARIKAYIRDKCISQCRAYINRNIDKFWEIGLEEFDTLLAKKVIPLNNIRQNFDKQYQETVDEQCGLFLEGCYLKVDECLENHPLDLTNAYNYVMLRDNLRFTINERCERFVNFLSTSFLKQEANSILQELISLRMLNIQKIHRSIDASCREYFNERGMQDFEGFLAQYHHEVTRFIYAYLPDLNQEESCTSLLEKLQAELRLQCDEFINKRNACNLLIDCMETARAEASLTHGYNLFVNFIERAQAQSVTPVNDSNSENDSLANSNSNDSVGNRPRRTIKTPERYGFK